MVYFHALMAGSSIILGTLQMFGPKFGLRHRWIGYGYFATMALTALSSFTQTSMTGGHSYLHLLAVLVLLTLGQNIWYLRRGNYLGHAYSMTYLYAGLMTAGFLAANRHGLDLSVPVIVVVILGIWTLAFRYTSRLRSLHAV